VAIVVHNQDGGILLAGTVVRALSDHFRRASGGFFPTGLCRRIFDRRDGIHIVPTVNSVGHDID
jgi:hypothetical protein